MPNHLGFLDTTTPDSSAGAIDVVIFVVDDFKVACPASSRYKVIFGEDTNTHLFSKLSQQVNIACRCDSKFSSELDAMSSVVKCFDVWGSEGDVVELAEALHCLPPVLVGQS